MATQKYSRKHMSKNKKSVSRAYGGVLSAGAVRERIVRAFLVEEQKIVKVRVVGYLSSRLIARDIETRVLWRSVTDLARVVRRLFAHRRRCSSFKPPRKASKRVHGRSILANST